MKRYLLVNRHIVTFARHLHEFVQLNFNQSISLVIRKLQVVHICNFHSLSQSMQFNSQNISLVVEISEGYRLQKYVTFTHRLMMSECALFYGYGCRNISHSNNCFSQQLTMRITTTTTVFCTFYDFVMLIAAI